MLKQRIENLEKEAAAAVQPCDCCGRDIHFGNACVEFVRLVNQSDIDADGIITATPIDDDIVALICADCGNRYSDARSIRKELGNELGITDLKEIPPDGSAVALLADQDHECDYCGKIMISGNARVDLDMLISQVDRSGEDGQLFTPIRADNLITLCAKCGGGFGRERVEEAVKEMIGRLGGRRVIDDMDDYWDDDDEDDFEEESEMNPKGNKEYKPVKIIEVGAEGGRITLSGYETEQGEWRFFRETDESSLMSLMPKEDTDGPEFRTESETVSGWSNALKILNRYPWPCLYPLYVHPDFTYEVMQELKRASAEMEHIDFGEWDAVCAGKDRFEKV